MVLLPWVPVHRRLPAMGPKEREKQTCAKSVMYGSSLGMAHFVLSSFNITEARALSQENVVMH